MGLDTTHDCWHGPCSTFNEWRTQLHAAITGRPATKEDLVDAWARGFYENQDEPINVLMNHSDCDGKIAYADTLPLAAALDKYVDAMNAADVASGYGEFYAESTRRFIGGLILAYQHGEDVEFH